MIGQLASARIRLAVTQRACAIVLMLDVIALATAAILWFFGAGRGVPLLVLLLGVGIAVAVGVYLARKFAISLLVVLGTPARRPAQKLPPKAHPADDAQLAKSVHQRVAAPTRLREGQGRPEAVLALRGGGVKGVALVAAVAELESWYEFRGFVGTSAGAIAATLLAGGESGESLVSVIRAMNFREDILGAPFGWNTVNGLRKSGHMYTHTAFKAWFTKRFPHVQQQIQDGARRLVICISSTSKGLCVWDSSEWTGRPMAPGVIVDALCASMSIPFLFQHGQYENGPAFDGGLLANFPMNQALRVTDQMARSGGPKLPVVGLYLHDPGAELAGVAQTLNSPAMVAKGVFAAWLQQDEWLNTLRTVGQSQYVVKIDTSPIATGDFDMTELETTMLELAGRVAGLRHLLSLDLSDEERVQVATRHAELEAQHKELQTACVSARRAEISRAEHWQSVFLIPTMLVTAFAWVFASIAVAMS